LFQNMMMPVEITRTAKKMVDKTPRI